VLVVVVVSMGSTRCGRASSSGARLPLYLLRFAYCSLLAAHCFLLALLLLTAAHCLLLLSAHCLLLAALTAYLLLTAAYCLLTTSFFTYYQAPDYRIHNECHSRQFTRIHTRRPPRIHTSPVSRDHVRYTLTHSQATCTCAYDLRRTTHHV
jgi:hypothetical protein